VIVKRRHFYNVDNYSRVRLRKIGRSSIIDSYRGAPVINSRVIKGFKEMRNRFNFRNIEARRKPHRSIIKRIQHGKPDGRRLLKGRERVIKVRSRKITPEKRVKHTPIKTPGVSGKIIPTRKIKKPEKIRFKKGQHKTPMSIVKKVRSKPRVQRSITRTTPRTKMQRFTPRTKVQRSTTRLKVRRKGL
jgi:hypothetical protein